MKTLLLGCILWMGSLVAHPTNTIYVPYQTHQFTTRAVDGSNFFIEDGSVWEVPRYSRDRLLSWYDQDYFKISLNHDYWSDYKYYITNTQTGEIIEANLKQGPIESNPRTKIIIAIDHIMGDVYLEDGSGYRTRWRIEEEYPSLLRKWEVGDHVILGSYPDNRWFASWVSDADTVLINVPTNKALRAKEL